MSPQGSDFFWEGEQKFWMVGTDRHEDTLRVESNYVKEERPLKLILPTLCITYADMAFTNGIGGEQKNYPASRSYGPTYFDPPIVIAGEEEVERLTWIRGAHRVVIGPDETEIEWYGRRSLVIPRLRIDESKTTEALLAVPETRISMDKELAVRVMQYADGRHIGGVRLEKRHPEWQPSEEPKTYDLWIRLINGETMAPMPEAMLNLFRWDRKGGLRLVDRRYTDGDGAIHDPRRDSRTLEAVTLQMPGWHAVARAFRPLPSQRVRFHMRAWPLREDAVPYTWRRGDTLEGMALLTGYTPDGILRRNRLADPDALRPGMRITLPCHAAIYHMEPGDTFAWLARAFGFASVEELAKLNGLRSPSQLDGGRGISLPGWHFFYAPPGVSLDRIDGMFGLPLGASRTVGRVHHPDPRLPYEAETIAVPTGGLIEKRVSA